jgi:hypothetical protein
VSCIDGPYPAQYEDGYRVDQGIAGQLYFELGVSEGDADLPDTKLCAFFDTMELGSDDEPKVVLIVKSVDPAGNDGGLYLLNVSHLRQLCNLAEAMHNMGDAQWKHVSQIDLYEANRKRRVARAEGGAQ